MTQPDINLNNNESAIIYENPHQTESFKATKDATKFMSNFCDSIVGLKLNENQTNAVFKLCETLVTNLNQLNHRLIMDENEMDAPFVLETTTNFMCGELSSHNSTYKRQKEFERSDMYVVPKELAIGTRFENKKCTNFVGQQALIPQSIQNSFVYVSILETLRSIFKSDENIRCYFEENNTLDHKCQDGLFKHFCCGSSYKTSQFFQENPLALQIGLASDDFEICNPLQSKSGIHKVCAIYFTIKNMPVKFLSRLSNIYLVALCNVDDLKSKTTDFNNLWQPIVNELSFLEKVGIDVKKGTNLKGTLTNLSFDNLGANSSLGYVSCFRANYFCRYCTATREETQAMARENIEKIRTKSEYENHLKIIAQSETVKYDETKGIKYYCKLNDLKDFHILDRPAFDSMHDLYEGCIPFVMKSLFELCIKNKVFTEEELDWMVQFNDYGRLNAQKNPSQISLRKRSLGQNAAQSLCLFKHIPFIFHQFKDHPIVKSVWICVTSLLRVTEIIDSYEINEKQVLQLEKEIEVHLKELASRFKVKIKPKHHFLLHYPSNIRLTGPIRQNNMMRPEAKHQQLKSFATGTKNFRNINKTMATKHQQFVCLNGHSYEDVIEISIEKPIDNLVYANYEYLLYDFQESGKRINEINWIKVNGKLFEKNLMFIHENKLFSIKKIFLIDNNCSFVCKKIEIMEFDLFLNCFEVHENIIDREVLINMSDIKNKKSFEFKCLQGKKYVMDITVILNRTGVWVDENEAT